MMRVFTKMRLPDVTAYLIAGVLIGPYCLGGLGIHGLGFTSMHEVEMLSLLSEVALGWSTYKGAHMSMYAVNVSVPKT